MRKYITNVLLYPNKTLIFFDMSDFGNRLLSVIKDNNISQTKLSEMLEVSTVSINNYVKRDRLPNADFLIKLKVLFPETDLGWLLTGVKPTKKYLFDDLKYAVVKEPTIPLVISANAQGEENVILVPHYAQAGYLDGYGDPEYLEMLPSYRLPLLNNGTFRMFEVKGHSMTPTLHDSSIAVGEWCENFTDIQDDQIYIVVTKDDGIVIKRLLNRIDKYGNLYLKSDNRSEYPSYTIKPEDVVELWKLKTAFVFNFSNPADLYDRVTDLESEMMQLRAVLVK